MATIERPRGGSAAPAGLQLRPYAGEADLPGIARVINAEHDADGRPGRTNVQELQADYGHPSEAFDAARDVTVAEVDGRIVGVGWRAVIETTDGLLERRMDGAVEPAWRRRGVGTALFAENERRHLARIATAARGDLRPALGSWCGTTNPGAIALLEANGFERARYFFDMVRPSLDDVTDVPLPDGLEVRPVTRELAHAVFRADVEAFADHWGGFDRSDEQFQRWMESPSNDLSLWIAAFDGDDVAGGVINVIDDATNEALGIRRAWLASVFTRRPWRRRGLARALISRSLVALRERGMTSAALGVDADNPSGALGLYEDLGFEVDYRSIAWRKVLT
ncbi:MAG TPA: GNAT family N-acetyltransferase [Candidatus Binatia bacterium]|nr:GNAT family N-acetyltransferase [Candidatus Binatia bacterium]